MKSRNNRLMAALVVMALLLSMLPSSMAMASPSAKFDSIVWKGAADKDAAAVINAVQNNTRKNASGDKITSNAHSNAFPGIYFIWDSKQNDNGYLKVSAPVFTVFESFVLTAKQANIYWDFLIAPAKDQQLSEDNCFIFFIPKVNDNKNINMVFISGWTEKKPGDPEEPIEPKEPETGNGFGTDPNDGLQVGNIIWAKTNIDTYKTFATRPDMLTCFYQWNRSKAWPATGAYVTEWDSSLDESVIWTDTPIPEGWRLPTETEFMALFREGTVWAEADPSNSARGNMVIGRFYGPDANNATMNNMGRSIFIPANGFRFGSGSLLYVGMSPVDCGKYWTSTMGDGWQNFPKDFPSMVFMHYFKINFPETSFVRAQVEKNFGANIRPVRDVTP